LQTHGRDQVSQGHDEKENGSRNGEANDGEDKVIKYLGLYGPVRQVNSGLLMQEQMIEISFGRSSSPNFEKAVKIASSLPGYNLEGEGKGSRHKITFKIDSHLLGNWDKIGKLIDIVKSWKSFVLSLDGMSIPHWDFVNTVSAIYRCYQEKVMHKLDDGYCCGRLGLTSESEFFGCRHIGGVQLVGHAHYTRTVTPPWYKFGSLSDDLSYYAMDKASIEERLVNSAGRGLCKFCPAFDIDRVKSVIDTLPDKIFLGENSGYDVQYSEIDPNKPIGIERSRRSLTILTGLRRQDEESEVAQRNVPNTAFSDIAGQDKAVRIIKDLIQLPLSHPDYFRDLGVQAQAGVLLHGPPGNGKTLLAKAVAGESNAHFELINGPELLSQWVGESERNLRGVFERAQGYAPSVVFIDEIDSIAPSRDHQMQHHNIQLVSQLLVLLDGFKARQNVVVVAATNRIDAVDSAILRSGRFDYHILVGLPDELGRLAILRIHTQKMNCEKSLCLEMVAELTKGFSGADLANLCREAGLIVIKKGIEDKIPSTKLRISKEDLLDAFEQMRCEHTGQ